MDHELRLHHVAEVAVCLLVLEELANPLELSTALGESPLRTLLAKKGLEPLVFVLQLPQERAVLIDTDLVGLYHLHGVFGLHHRTLEHALHFVKGGLLLLEVADAGVGLHKLAGALEVLVPEPLRLALRIEQLLLEPVNLLLIKQVLGPRETEFMVATSTGHGK